MPVSCGQCLGTPAAIIKWLAEGRHRRWVPESMASPYAGGWLVP